jgi:hypothetical protein
MIIRSLSRLEGLLLLLYQYSSAHSSRAEKVDSGEIISGAFYGGAKYLSVRTIALYKLPYVTLLPYEFEDDCRFQEFLCTIYYGKALSSIGCDDMLICTQVPSSWENLLHTCPCSWILFSIKCIANVVSEMKVFGCATRSLGELLVTPARIIMPRKINMREMTERLQMVICKVYTRW